MHTSFRVCRLLGAGLILSVLLGCDGVRDISGPDAPRFDPALAAPQKRPSVALVLGGGGPRGFAHIGVLKVLERANIQVDTVVGTSVGALIGALYAAEVPADQLEKMALALNVTEFLTVNGSGLAGSGDAIERLLRREGANERLEGSARRFAATATRMSDGQQVLFNCGLLGPAVRASSAIPGRFAPVRINGVTYFDGDESQPVPVKVARAMGADVVIAVDVSAYLSSTPASAPPEWRARDQRRAAQIAAETNLADVTIHPDLGYYADVREAYRMRSIALAEQLTEQALPKIRAAIAAAQAVATAKGT